MTNRTTVKPEWQHENVVAENKFFGARGQRIYPAPLDGHEVEVAYTYEKQRGRQFFVEIKYSCIHCDGEVGVESDHLSSEDDETIAELRGWMYGFFVEHDCV